MLLDGWMLVLDGYLLHLATAFCFLVDARGS